MLPALEAPEIFFGLCSPVGTDNDRVRELIAELLMPFEYNTVPFKVTTLMKQVEISGLELTQKPLEARYDTHIKYANKVRSLVGYPSALAMMCSGAVKNFRRQNSSDPTNYIPRTAYVFDQFKRKEEIEALRQVYGRLFFVVSIYSEKKERTRRLTEEIAKDHNSSRPQIDHENDARLLVQRDEDEEGVPTGQRLRDAFPLADVFINIDDETGSRETLRRFIHLFFGSNSISPTRDEYGLYIAKSAALRSLDLSRQVGAAIFAESGEVVSLGCNEVPKPGGGTYWAGAELDGRDYKIGRDENERIKKSIIADFVRRMSRTEIFQSNRSEDDLVEAVMESAETKGSEIQQSQMMDLIEFGRMIHAEMSAITDAARLGKSIKGSKLYCTTFPCHICAKHIVASGVDTVTFIEPYPKSYAEQLHSDSILLGAFPYEGPKTQFRPFIGISPFRFRELFERTKRKNEDGTFKKWEYGKPMPIVRYTIANWLQNEAALVGILHKEFNRLVEAGLVTVAGYDRAESPESTPRSAG